MVAPFQSVAPGLKDAARLFIANVDDDVKKLG
jgi:hypothetical protein